MKSAEITCALLVAALRVFAITLFYGALNEAARAEEPSLAFLLVTDWFAVLALFWAALAIAGDRPRVRANLLVGACIWTGIIYAIHQGPHLLWLFGEA